jgi:dethiobiotin synthetase
MYLRTQAAAAAAATSPAAADAYLLYSSTLFAFRDPVSPHLAAAAEQRVVPDGHIVAAVAQQMRAFVQQQQQQQQQEGPLRGLCVVETAGGVTSPGPSGTLQVCVGWRVMSRGGGQIKGVTGACKQLRCN